MRKKAEKRARRGELRREYDLSKLNGGVRGKYVERYRAGTNLVSLSPDVAEYFPDEQEVNKALPVLIAASIKTGKALLTSCSSGKYSATSGDSDTRFVPARYRSTYFPRTPPFNLDRSYSRRSSPRLARFSAFFLIKFSLAAQSVSPNYKTPANSFQPLHFRASHSNHTTQAL